MVFNLGISSLSMLDIILCRFLIDVHAMYIADVYITSVCSIHINMVFAVYNCILL